MPPRLAIAARSADRHGRVDAVGQQRPSQWLVAELRIETPATTESSPCPRPSWNLSAPTCSSGRGRRSETVRRGRRGDTREQFGPYEPADRPKLRLARFGEELNHARKEAIAIRGERADSDKHGVDIGVEIERGVRQASTRLRGWPSLLIVGDAAVAARAPEVLRCRREPEAGPASRRR